MLFNSPVFMFAFLPTALAIFLLLRRFELFNLSQAALVLLSLFFYGYWNPVYLGLLLASMAVNLLFARQVSKLIALPGTQSEASRPKLAKILFITSTIFNIGLLAYFKYAGFLTEQIIAMGYDGIAPVSIVLPLAISFFTFQQVAYQVDTFQGKITQHEPIKYALFVTFFPQLIAGPIVHHSEMMPQFESAVQKQRNRIADIQLGLFIFAVGLFKKVVVADTMAQISSPIFNQAISGNQIEFIAAWIGALGYTVQIYFDFSGYCDMATGAAMMFGIKLPANFFSPYKALSISEFWRRWHITLSRFLRDYLYIPLGGNRISVPRRWANLMTTMVLGGLWHGAGWTFIFWGFLHGLYLVINHGWTALMVRSGHAIRLNNAGWYRFFCWFVTMMAVVVAWVFFRAESFTAAANILSGMVGLNGVALHPMLAKALATVGLSWNYIAPHISAAALPFDDLFAGTVLIIAALGGAALLPNVYEITAKNDPLVDSPKWIKPGATAWSWAPNLNWALATGFLLALALMSVFSAAPSEFLYFRF